MFVKIKEDKHYQPAYTLCIVKPTGELNPRASIVYDGTAAPKTGTQEKVNRQLLTDSLAPHKRAALSAIFDQEKDQSGMAKAQTDMFERFVDVYTANFQKALESGEATVTLPNDPAPPVYFYQVRTEHNSFYASESFGEAVRNEEPKKIGVQNLTKIAIYAGESNTLANIYVREEDKELAIKTTQMTILNISQEAHMDLNDRMKKFKGPGNDGPDGMK